MYDIRSKNLPWLNKVIDSIENAEKVVNPPQNPMTRKFKILFENVSLKWLEVSLNIIPAKKQPIKFTRRVPTGNVNKVGVKNLDIE